MPEDVSTELTKVFRQCIKQSGVDRDVLVMSKKGEFADDKRLKEYYFCVAKLWGVMNEAGDILPDVLTKKTQEIYRDEALTKKLAGLCGVRKDQPLETAFQMAQCYYKNAPGDLKIMQSGVLSDEQKATIRANIRECSEETNAIKDVVQQARQGNFADNQSLKEYLLCIAKKNQAQDANGKLNVATIREKLGTVLGAKDADEIAEKCAKERATPSDTAFEAFKCFYDNAPEVAPVF
uniref:Odorant binding protein n=1 Tax=Cylas formicarius TaxID=197179 RepID=A0A6B7M0D9_CYLFO|nr:odorant binding protein [Cylas formicarius]